MVTTCIRPARPALNSEFLTCQPQPKTTVRHGTGLTSARLYTFRRTRSHAQRQARATLSEPVNCEPTFAPDRAVRILLDPLRRWLCAQFGLEYATIEIERCAETGK